MSKSESLPVLSIIVCTYNRSSLLQECLKSLQEQSLHTDKFEILVIDNNSTDNTKGVVGVFQKKSPNIRYLFESEQGLSSSRNRGFHESKGEIIAYIDDDAQASEDWAKLLVQSFEKLKLTPAIVGGPIFPYYEKPPPKWFNHKIEIRDWGEKKRFLTRKEKKFGFSGSNMAFQKRILEKYGGFDINFGMKGEKMGFAEEGGLFYVMSEDDLVFWYDPKLIVHHWTPAEKLTLKYQLKRAYVSGKFHGNIINKNFFNWIVKPLIKIPLWLIVIPFLYLTDVIFSTSRTIIVINLLFANFGIIASKLVSR